MKSAALTCLIWLAAAPAVPSASGTDAAAQYAAAHAAFHTQLRFRSPAPQDYRPTAAPPGAHLLNYFSDGLPLNAVMSDVEPGAPGKPAVLVLHGGFAWDKGDWTQLATPYIDAGFRVMMPILRGENGQLGNFSLFFSEVDDVVAAAQALARQPGVDATRMYVAGHSAGGTLTLLSAMAYDFRAGTSFSGAVDMSDFAHGYFRDNPEDLPFDWSPREFTARSANAFPSSFRCPFRIFHGDQEAWARAPSLALAKAARAAGGDVAVQEFPGDHFTAVDGELKASIAFFRSHGAL